MTGRIVINTPLGAVDGVSVEYDDGAGVSDFSLELAGASGLELEGDEKGGVLEDEEVEVLVTVAVSLSEEAEENSLEEVSDVSEVGEVVKLPDEEVISDIVEVSVCADEDSELE